MFFCMFYIDRSNEDDSMVKDGRNVCVTVALFMRCCTCSKGSGIMSDWKGDVRSGVDEQALAIGLFSVIPIASAGATLLFPKESFMVSLFLMLW